MDTKRVGSGITSPLNGQSGVQKSAKLGQVQDGNAVEKKRSESTDFDVGLSERAKEMAEARKKAMEIARNTPDVREDRVAELKQRIQAGEYKVDAGLVADGMLREAIKDELAKNPE